MLTAITYRKCQESVRGLLAVLGWDRAVLYGVWPDTEKFGSMPRKLAWEGRLYGLSRRRLSQVVFNGQRCIMPSESVLHLWHSGVLRHAP